MADTEKPRRKPGSMCPLWRKDVSECCHTCEWYESIPIGRTDAQGRVSNVEAKWGCTANHLLQVFRDWGAILEGVQQATESRGNAVAARLDVIAEDMMTVSDVSKEVARHGGLVVGPPAVQRRIGGARLMIEKEGKQ